MKEGDTPSWFYFLSNGLGDADHPAWGGWGGRFVSAGGKLYRDAKDTVGEKSEARATVWRWRPAFQNDFAARMDWCIKPKAQANHPPLVVVNGDGSRKVLNLQSAAGSAVTVDAAGSSDPDGDKPRYRWWIYREAGTYSGAATLAGDETPKVTVDLPRDAAGKTIHLILTVHDGGVPELCSYRRVVLDVLPQDAKLK